MKHPLRKPATVSSGSTELEPAEEQELFDWIMNHPDPKSLLPKEVPVPPHPATPPKAGGSQSKVRFKREVSRDHPDAVEGVIKQLFDLPVTATVAEICLKRTG